MPTETIKVTIGHGCLFEVWDRLNSPAQYVAVGQVNEITLPALSMGSAETTHFQSADGIKTFIPTLAEWSEAQINMNFRPGNRETVLLIDAIKRAGGVATKELLLCRVDFKNGSPSTKFLFSAIPSITGISAPLEDKKTLSATFKPAGDLTVQNATYNQL